MFRAGKRIIEVKNVIFFKIKFIYSQDNGELSREILNSEETGMLVTHIYFNGNCKEAIELYKNALYADVKTLIEDSVLNLVVHAEMVIHDELLMLNDFGNNDGVSRSGGYQLCLQFENVDELKRAYSKMEFESITIDPIQSTDYSPCTVRFEDRFGVRWAFWV